MKNSWESKKILAYGKRFSIFTSIMFVLLCVFSCNNLLVLGGGSLVIAMPGTRATIASSYTIELTGTNGTTQSKTLAGGTTAQFDDLDPDTYNISVKGKDDSGLVVLYGMSNATVEAGATASATVNLGTVANDLNSLQQAITTGGIVYIGSDINVTSSLTVNTDVTLLPAYKNVTLTKAGDIDLISVSEAVTLTVGGNDYTITLDGDSGTNSNTKSLINANGKGSTVYLNKNSIVTNNSGTGLTIKGTQPGSKAYLYLNGGTISNNKSGGVSLSYAEFIMNGGSINGNSLNSQISGGAGVSVGGSIFTMKGGTISDNEMTSNDGGAIKVISGGSFTMDGGSIEGNSATGSGGGVYVAGSFIMNGGSIKGNSAATGKGVYAKTDNFKMSGNAVIDLGNDVCLGDGNKITVTGALSTTSTVALITPTNYSSPKAVLAVENGVKLADVIKKFKVTQPEDGAAEYIINDEGKLQKVGAQ